MFGLDNFPKIGVRVPVKLRKRVKALAVELEGDAVYLTGDVTMEGIFAMAALEFLEMGEEERLDVIRRRSPELLAMFEAEMPTPAGEGSADTDKLPTQGTTENYPRPSKSRKNGGRAG